MNHVTPRDLAAFLAAHPGALLVDVREPWEHAIAALPDSRLVPLGQLIAGGGEALDDPDRVIVVYCHHGVRSLQACAVLGSLGYASVHNLAGGIDRFSIDVDSTIPRY